MCNVIAAGMSKQVTQKNFLGNCILETTWQILCASDSCAPRKNGVF